MNFMRILAWVRTRTVRAGEATSQGGQLLKGRAEKGEPKRASRKGRAERSEPRTASREERQDDVLTSFSARPFRLALFGSLFLGSLLCTAPSRQFALTGSANTRP